MEQIVGRIGVGDDALEIDHVLLRVPAERVAIDRQTGLSGIVEEVGDGGEIHRAVVFHHGRILEGIARHQFLKVLLVEHIAHAFLVEFAGRGGPSHLKDGIFGTIDIAFQHTVGIERVGEMFGFSLDEVMAFGDSDNDIEMLSGVGISVAMGNAIESVKSVATYTTDTNNNDGISKALAHYGLIHAEVGERFDSQDDNFNKVKDFHHQMDGETCETPRLYGVEEADHRSDFKVEEIVEFLYATSKGNPQAFQQSVTNLHEAVDKAVTKIKSKEHPETPLVGQGDALTDLLYLT